MENLISVIVCTYNQERTIARTLDSILLQQCHIPYEIIVGEDCSTDNTLSICQAYAEKYPNIIRLIANKANKGIIDNYFDCLLACQGKWIADCAGDDFWTDPQKLEKEVAILEAHPEVTLVHTDWLCYDEEKGATFPPYPADSKHMKPFQNGNELIEDILTQSYRPVIHLCTSLYRRDVFIQAYQEDINLFRNKEFGCEDMQIAFIMSRRGRIAYISDKTLNYSVGHATISNTLNDEKQFCFVKRIANLVYYISTNYKIKSKRIENYLIQRQFELAMHAFRSSSPALRDEIKTLGQQWHIKESLSTQFVILIMSSSITWRIGLMARRLFVRWKKMRN